MKKQFSTFPTLLFGRGTARQIETIIQRLNCERIVIISDQMFCHTKHIKRLETWICLAGKRVETKYITSEKIEMTNLVQTTSHLLDDSCDLLIGYGRKHIMNVTKWLSVMLKNELAFINGLDTKQIKVSIPTILIPLDMTTGDELVPFISLYQQGNLLNVFHREFTPSHVIYDPTIITKGASYQKVGTYIYALAHAIETYFFSLHRGWMTTCALKAMKLIFRYIMRVTYNEKDEQASEAMLRASMLLGMAKIDTPKRMLTESVIEPIVKKFQLPYTVALGLMLPYIVKIYEKINRRRIGYIMEELHVNIFDEKTAFDYLTFRIENIIRSLGFPSSLAMLDIDKRDLKILTDS